MKKGIISIISALIGAAAGAGTIGKLLGKAAEKEKNMSEKHLVLFLMMNQWVKVKQERKNLASYLVARKYKRIAVYGMSYAGETLLSELKDTEVQVAYGIDNKADGIYTDIEIFSMEDTLDEVDAIIVTAITFFDEIEENLKEKVTCPIISLEDILYEV